MPTEQDYQYDINGVLVGHDTPFMVTSVSGLFELPDIVISDTQREGADGEYSSNDETLTGRTIQMDIAMLGEPKPDNDLDADTLYERLQAATSDIRNAWPLYIKRPDRPERLIWVKTRKRAFTSDYEFAVGNGKGSLLFKALDPRIYEALEIQSEQIDVYSVSGGMTFPEVFPLTFGTAGVQGVTNLVNVGTYPTPAKFYIVGPVTNPALVHVGLQRTLQITGSLSFNEVLEIDLDARTVLLAGVNRRSWLTTSQWFMLQPGDNEIRFTGTTSGEPRMSAIYRSAWA